MTPGQASVAGDSGKGGAVLGLLAAAMFVYVIDTTLMNVSISALVKDLDTLVGAVQGAVTLYTLTMAAFMLTGAGIEPVVEEGLSKPATDRLVRQLADETPEVQAEAQRIFDEATLRGFQRAIMMGGVVALFGALVAFRLPRKKLEGDPGKGENDLVAETVANTTIPHLQLEMDDLPRPTPP